MNKAYENILLMIVNSNDTDDLHNLIFKIEEKFGMDYLRELNNKLKKEVEAKRYNIDAMYSIYQFIRLI